MRYAVVIGVEAYKHSNINSVAFATNDAISFQQAMQQNGCEEKNIHLLVNEQATTSFIMSTLQRLVYEVEENDELIFFFAGHGEICSGQQFLITYDTAYSNITNTALALDELFVQIRNFKRVTIFLDSCHSGMPISSLQRGKETVKRDPFELLKDLEYQVAFASCKNGEKSYGSDILSHGTWTYHVVQALTGNAPSTIYRANGELTSSSLQEYLYENVPYFVKKEHGEDKSQTPWFFGGLTREFLVRQSAEALTKASQSKVKKKVAKHTNTSKVKVPTLSESMTVAPVVFKDDANINLNIQYFYSLKRGFVKNLSGYRGGRGGHNEPTTHSKSSKDFLVRIAKNDIEEEIQDYLKQIQEVDIYRASQISVELTTEWGNIDCNEDFYIQVLVEQDEINPKKYIMKNELVIHYGKIKEFREVLTSLSFSIFDRVVYAVPYKNNIRETLLFLEQEAAVNDNVIYYYTPGSNNIEITLEGLGGKLILSESSNNIEFYSNKSKLNDVYGELQIFLSSIQNAKVKSLVTGTWK
ncbi:caspase domain-containing protein [Paenibacillus sp. 2RAB27]|uniref:caspase family protein n=1 Tax=Paenibacillus sp. 2RAB27 TaxID=3232991 RepID=UPI003F9D466A